MKSNRRSAFLIAALTALCFSSVALATTATPSLPSPTPTPQALPACIGDCDASRQVTVDEIVALVAVALDRAAIDQCGAGDANRDGKISIDEIIRAVDNAIGGCSDVVPRSLCGNGIVDAGEDCDDAGLCVGGSNAGETCTRDAQCFGPGMCDGGNNIGRSCDGDADCTGSHCVHCRPVGGDGCAANCTSEIDIRATLVAGRVGGPEVTGSGFVVNSDVLTIPLPIERLQSFRVGRPGLDGTVPFVVVAASVGEARVRISEHCACVRAVDFKTCGGTAFGRDGRPATSCTEGFSGREVCPADQPCSHVFGPGNSANGIFSCNAAGLPNVDVAITQDAGGGTGIPSPAQITLSGRGASGSALFLSSTAIEFDLRFGCYPDFCAVAAPINGGLPIVAIETTARASAKISNTNGEFSNELVDSLTGEPGTVADCAVLLSSNPTLSGFRTVAATPSIDLGWSLGSAVITSKSEVQ